jgi:hypothetical protein
MNAILQPLVHCPPFFNLFYDIGQSVPQTLGKKLTLVEAMIMFIKEIQDTGGKGKWYAFSNASTHTNDRVKRSYFT